MLSHTPLLCPVKKHSGKYRKLLSEIKVNDTAREKKENCLQTLHITNQLPECSEHHKQIRLENDAAMSVNGAGE